MDKVYILTLKDKPDGVYSMLDDYGNHVIPIFENPDDIERYHYMVQEYEEHPEMQIVKIEPKVIISACEERFQKYVIITEDDFLVPPSAAL